MSSETDDPRQRTVAELLAAHGDSGAASATGRRRRRRAEEPDEGGAPPAPTNGSARETRRAAPAAVPDRALLREPVPWDEDLDDAPARGFDPPAVDPWDQGADSPPRAFNGAPAGPAPWEQANSAPPRAFEREPEPPAPRGPARHAPPRAFEPEPAPPPTPPPAPPPRPPWGGAEQRESAPPVAPPPPVPAPPLGGRPRLDPQRERPTDQMPRVRNARQGMIDPGLTGPIEQHRRGVAADTDDNPDAEPATMVASTPVGAEAWQRSRTSRRRAEPDDEGGPPTQASVPVDFDDHPAGLGEDFDEAEYHVDEDDEPAGSASDRGDKSDASPGQAWAAVVAQWIVGAIGGAALWVGFRFLWRELPVVALAAAVLVTVGLVVVVRALLRNNDMRTTISAVLVGLLLTVSPAILVLLGR